jgi:hypothetical protein
MLKSAAKTMLLLLCLILFFATGSFAWEIETPLPLVSQTGTPATAISSGGPTVGDFISNGAFSYSVPINVPPGRLGIAPKLNLDYNSQRGTGWLGVGWGLDLGYIQRNTTFGLEYTDNGVTGNVAFIYVKDGAATQLVLKQGTTNEYLAKIDDGSRLRFFYNGASWTVYDKSGMVLSFGSSADSRQTNANPGKESQVFKWCIDLVKDPHGNTMSVQYFKDRDGGVNYGEIYPKTILYTGVDGSNSYPYKIDFVLEGRCPNDQFMIPRI